jgi:hypothetical protein
MLDIVKLNLVGLKHGVEKMETGKWQDDEFPVTYAIFWMHAYGKDWREKREEELKKQREKMGNGSKK